MSSKRPWMPLYIDDYLAGAAHLEAHEHGAYLLLMMRYWSKGCLPDDEDLIRRISRLSIKQWKESRETIQAFFFNGWHHERIDAEIQKAIEKSKVNSANAGKSHSNRKASASKAQVVSIVSAVKPQPTLHTSPKNSLSTARDEIEEIKHASDVGTPIDPNFWPCENHLAVCKIDGASDEVIKAEVEGFIAAKQESAALSANWDASWAIRWKRWKEHRDKLAVKAKPRGLPRVEYDVKLDWDTYCSRYRRNMAWPKNIGPDPDSAACRCPLEILQKHGYRATAEAAS